jgi:hypothetical protein
MNEHRAVNGILFTGKLDNFHANADTELGGRVLTQRREGSKAQEV